jgi:hypothetical protein
MQPGTHFWALHVAAWRAAAAMLLSFAFDGQIERFQETSSRGRYRLSLEEIQGDSR